MRIEGPVGNHFRMSFRLVPTASQAVGYLWAMRNATAGMIVQVNLVRLRALQVGAPTAAIEDRFSLFAARPYTASETTGGLTQGTAIKTKLDSQFAGSQVNLQQTNVAAGLTGGTRSLPDQAIASGSLWVPAAVPTATVQGMTEIFTYQPDVASERVLTLYKDEGWMLSCDNALGTASGIVLYLDLMWSER